MICVFDEDEGGQIDVYRPSDSEYQIYLEIYNSWYLYYDNTRIKTYMSFFGVSFLYAFFS